MKEDIEGDILGNEIVKSLILHSPHHTLPHSTKKILIPISNE